ncbi:hypothetical protein EK904_008908 [Melospiza melodia maxima]|nr:hypothetical protein EK904_008908 [Melospiza melodia maxima]
MRAKVLPSPSNLNYSLTHICTLTWTWNPPENISSSCNLEYSSDIVINGVPEDRRVRNFLPLVVRDDNDWCLRETKEVAKMG